MNKSSFKLLYIFLIVMLLLTACEKIANNDSEFIKLLKSPNVKDINQSIKLTIDPYQPSELKNGKNIHLLVTNTTNKYIKFPVGDNSQLFLFESNQKSWSTINNRVDYGGKEIILLPQGEKGFHEDYLLISPIIENQQIDETIRIVVTGYIVKDGNDTNEAVSAYIDLTLKP